MKHHSTKRDYWRSLEHLAQTPEIRAMAENEFSSYDPDEMMKLPLVTRRRFVQLMSASMALAGLTLSGCRRWPQDKLAPYTSNPTNRIPGVPEQYATVMEISGVASPLLVTSFDGRPIKIEGNPSHPYSQTVAGKIGAADAMAQASVLELYDPDRLTSVIDRTGSADKLSDWDSFAAALRGAMSALPGDSMQGLAILSQASSSPTRHRFREQISKQYPKIQWVEFESLSRDNEIAGSVLALGKSARQVLHLDKASVMVFLDADPLLTHPAHVKYASDWASKRRSADLGSMNRVYVAESALTTTGAVADVRMGVLPSQISPILAALAATLGVGTASAQLSSDQQDFVNRAAADIKAHPNAAVVALGSHVAPQDQALCLALNNAIGAVGNTLTLHEVPIDQRPDHFEALAQLTDEIKSGAVSTLIMLGGNPVYDSPADIDFAGALKAVGTSIHLTLYDNETSALCKWVIPQAHYLESWSDARAYDGTISVVQPLIEPLYGGMTPEQLLAFIAGEKQMDSDVLVRATFSSLLPSGDSDTEYRRVLNDGMLAGTAYPEISATIQPVVPAAAAASETSGFEIRFLASPYLYDGRFAGSGWLQEMPNPMTKLVWDNAALISKADAEQLDVGIGDMLQITLDSKSLLIPAFILPGQPKGVIGLNLGYGRTAAGHIGTGVGVNVNVLRTRANAFAAAGAKVVKTGDTYGLVTTQDYHLIDSIGINQRQEQVGKEKFTSGEIIKDATLAEYSADPAIFHRKEDGSIALQLWEPPNAFNDPHAWGMAIDLGSCIGCHACVVACQAENNIPIVGKDQVERNRQMHWIRIDRYFKGEADDPNPEVVYQPLTCQQCENAPCEQVCPVGATMHDTEGLNVMVYNRCVGTRYCSNNCPYKVRRFNYLDFQSQDPRNDKYPKPYLNIPDQQQLEQVNKIKRMVFNPEVTVRMRGVMEKCTFCVQRIHTTQTAKRAAGEELVDGDIVTACQQACPTQAIVFGDLNDPNSRVAQWHQNNRAYGLLDADLNTRPRNRYLAKISNPA
jgi:MoCo/4Fe-4S cofactor protein with predicted Tat translocation signal